MQEQFCTQCGRHCPVSNLHCGRGRAYFEAKEAEKKQSAAVSEGADENLRSGKESSQTPPKGTVESSAYSLEDKILENIKLLGHHAHEGGSNSAGTNHLFSNLTEDEKNTLLTLLEKANQNFKNQPSNEQRVKKHHHHGHHRGRWHKHKH